MNYNSKKRTILVLVLLAGIAALVPAVSQAAVEPPAEQGQIPKPTIFDILQRYVVFVSGIAEILIVILFWKTVKDFAELAKVSKLQTEVRFRPWVGPSGGILHIRDDTENNKKQYAISIRNFGEVPSTAVTAISLCSQTLPNREILKSAKADKFNLGPLLPNMEKKYWIFLDSSLMELALQGSSELFVVLYFSYNYSGGVSGYGMISQFDRKTESFAHRDMWLD